jgi:hypothetical protein
VQVRVDERRERARCLHAVVEVQAQLAQHLQVRPLAVAAEHVGDAVRDPAALRTLAGRRQAAGAERVRLRPRAGRVDDGTREHAPLDVALLDDELERCLLTARVLELVDAVAGDAGHARTELQHARDLRQRGERLQVALHQLVARRVAVGIGRRPARALEHLAGDRVDVEVPRREHAHVTPLANARADRRAGLEHDRTETAIDQVRRRREPHGPRADDGDGQLVRRLGHAGDLRSHR